MVRHQNWQRRFSEFLSEHKKMPFQWGENDCVLFVGKSVKAITDQDFYSQYHYSNEEEAKKIIEDNGGIKGLISKALGDPHTNYKKAKRGDAVLMKLPEITAGVVDDSGAWIVSLTKTGTLKLPLRNAIYVWSV